jgi:hypothetical protein
MTDRIRNRQEIREAISEANRIAQETHQPYESPLTPQESSHLFGMSHAQDFAWHADLYIDPSWIPRAHPDGAIDISDARNSEPLAVIIKAFAKAHSPIRDGSEYEQTYLRFATQLAMWSNLPPEVLQYQDAQARTRCQDVSSLAKRLLQAIDDAASHAELDDFGQVAKFSEPNPAKVLFSQISYWGTKELIGEIASVADCALEAGVKRQSRGPKPALLLRAFIQNVHLLWYALTREAGWYRHAGTARGRFVDLAFEVHSILPSKFHLEFEPFARQALEALGEIKFENK